MGDDARITAGDIADSVDLAGIRSVLEETDVRYAVVFGSYATGSESPTSDLDICVRFDDNCTRRERFEQRNRIDSTLQSYAESFVDISDLESLPETVALNALRDGLLFYGDGAESDERRLEDRVADSSEQRTQRQREFIDRLAEGDV